MARYFTQNSGFSNPRNLLQAHIIKYCEDISDRILKTDTDKEGCVKRLKLYVDNYNKKFKNCRPIKIERRDQGNDVIFDFPFGWFCITKAKTLIGDDPDILPEDFARVIRTESGSQILVEKVFPDEFESEYEYGVSAKVHTQGMSITPTLYFEDENKAHEFYQNTDLIIDFTKKQVRSLLNTDVH